METLLHYLWPFMLFAACTSPGNAPEQEATTGDETAQCSLRVAVLPIEACNSLRRLAPTGIADTAGLHLELVEYASQWDCDTALLRGHVELAISDSVRLAFHRGRGEPLRPFLAIRSTWRLLASAAKDSAEVVRSVAQLPEHTVAVDRHSTAWELCSQVLAREGLPPDTIFRPQINDLCLRLQMLCRGQVDAAVLPEPLAEKALNEGHILLCSDSMARSLLVTTTDSATLPALKLLHQLLTSPSSTQP